MFIGESFIAQTGAIPRMTSELARKAGTIGTSESYRSFAVSGTQLTTGDIPNQYQRAKAESPVKVVLMDGGGNTAEVRCIWVDQRDTWEGNYDKFTSDGIHPTEAGSMASAQQIWDAMVTSCIAQ